MVALTVDANERQLVELSCFLCKHLLKKLQLLYSGLPNISGDGFYVG